MQDRSPDGSVADTADTSVDADRLAFGQGVLVQSLTATSKSFFVLLASWAQLSRRDLNGIEAFPSQFRQNLASGSVSEFRTCPNAS